MRQLILIAVVFLSGLAPSADAESVTFQASEPPAPRGDGTKGKAPKKTFVRSMGTQVPTLDALEKVNLRRRCKGGAQIEVDPRPVDYATAASTLVKSDASGADEKAEAAASAVAGNDTIAAWKVIDSVSTGCWYSDMNAELTTMQEGVDAMLFDDASYLQQHKGVDVKNVIMGRGGPVEELNMLNKFRVWPGPLSPEESSEDAALITNTGVADYKLGLLKDTKTGQLQNYFQRTKPENRFKLFCGTYSFAKKHHNVANERHVWGHKCERHMLFTNTRKPSQGQYEEHRLGRWEKPVNFEDHDIIEMEFSGGEKYQNMWQKTRAAFRRMAARSWELIEPFDWFFFGGDDIFLFPENLHKMLVEPPLLELNEAGVPLFMGYRHKQNWSQATFISGAAYVMNKAAVQLFAEGLMDNCMAHVHGHAEDVWLSECLQEMGVPSRDTRDHKGEDRFMVLTSGMMAELTKNWDYTWWWREYRARQYPRGMDIVSEYPIIFHFESGQHFKMLANRYYRMPHGDFPN